MNPDAPLSIRLRVRPQSGRNAANAAGRLSETLLMLGRVSEAIPVAGQAVAHADRSKKTLFSAKYERTALLGSGHSPLAVILTPAAAVFAEAEKIHLKGAIAT